MTQYVIQTLSSDHNKALFSCGIPMLDTYLKCHATQYKKKGLAITYVITNAKENEVLGYYSLSSYGIKLDQLPETIKKKLPRYPIIPVTLLGRLAVTYEKQGQSIGQHLLISALEKCFELSKKQGSVGVMVDAINRSAINFYKKFGFMTLADDQTKLFIPMKTISKLFL